MTVDIGSLRGQTSRTCRFEEGEGLSKSSDLRDQSTWVLIAAIFILTTIALVTFEAVAVPAEQASCAASRLCRAYGVFKDFQTLIAAGLALVAAWYTVNPVKAQLRKMSVQQDIAARGLIADRLEWIESRVEKLRLELADQGVQTARWAIL